MENLDYTVTGLFAIKIGGGDADSDTTRSDDGQLIVNKVGRLLFKNNELKTLEPVLVPTFNGVIERLRIDYEFDHTEKEPDLTLEQVQATQRIVNYGGLLHTLSNTDGYVVDKIHVKMDGEVIFLILVPNGDKPSMLYQAISKPSSMKIDSFEETPDEDGLVSGKESFITTAVIVGIIAYLFKMFFGKDKLSREVDAKVKEMLKPLAKSIAIAYEDYFSVARNIKTIVKELNDNGCQAKQHPVFNVMLLKDFMQQVSSFVKAGRNNGEDNLKSYLNGDMYMLPRPQHFITVHTRPKNHLVIDVAKKYSTKMTSLVLEKGGFLFDIRASSGISKSAFDEIVTELDKIHKANDVNGPMETDSIIDPQFGELQYAEKWHGWMLSKQLKLMNVNGNKSECRVWLLDETKSGVTEQQRRAIATLVKTPSFVQSKFDMSKFESFIDGFDIETPASEIVKKMRFEAVRVYPNGAFFIDVRGDEQINALSIEIYFDKSLSTIGFEYGEGGFGHMDIGK